MNNFSSVPSFSFTVSASNPSLSVSASSFPVVMSSLISNTSLPPPSSSSQTSVCSFDVLAFHLLLAVLYSFFFLFGLLGNLFALWVFFFLHSSRNSVQVLIINCTVADLILLACLPFRIFYHSNGNKWVLGPVTCRLVGNLFYMNMYISIMLLGLIGLDRYMRLKGRCTVRRDTRIMLWGHSWPWSWVACGALWGLSLVALVSMIITEEDREEGDKCFQYRPRHINAKSKAYFNAILVALFWLVFIMMVVSYAKIASQLMEVSREKPDLPNAQRYKQTAKKSFFVLFLFTICFGPYHAFRPVYIFSQLSGEESCDYLQLMDQTNEVMLLFSAFNSCLDPVMYFLLSGKVRKAVLQALGRRFGNRVVLYNNATSNSSNTDLRKPLASSELPICSLQPREQASVINSPLCHKGLTTFPTADQQ